MERGRALTGQKRRHRLQVLRVGGIDIHITEKERVELNRVTGLDGLNKVLKIKKVEKSDVGSDGAVHLDGGQAMCYARIRKIDSDNVRALRQQKVLNCVFDKLKNTNKTKQTTTQHTSSTQSARLSLRNSAMQDRRQLKE